VNALHVRIKRGVMKGAKRAPPAHLPWFFGKEPKAPLPRA